MVLQLSNIVSATVSSFIEYALIIVTIMIIWYIIKFFLVEPPTKEEKEASLQAQREAWGGMINEVGKKGKASREAREQKEYERGLENRANVVIDNLKDGFDAAADAIHALDQKNPSAAIDAVDEFETKLKLAWRNLRILQQYAKGNHKQAVENIRAQVDAVHVFIIDKIKGKIPRRVADWNAGDIDALRKELVSRRGSSGAIFNNLKNL